MIPHNRHPRELGGDGLECIHISIAAPIVSAAKIIGVITCRNGPLLRHFDIKTIILPRQARDKHKENSRRQ